jgi:hypothetical protein
MFAPTRYLEWAWRYFGQVPFDLATSGIPPVEPGFLREGAERAPGSPPEAWRAFSDGIAAYNGVSVAEVLPALGTTQALWLACAAILSPGDDVLVEAPAYEPLLRIPEGAGARVVPFERDAAAGFALDPERVARAMTPRTRLVLVSNLHNPTGARAPDDDLRAVARVAAAHGAYVLVDDGGVFTGSARRLAPNVLAVSSLTKCYGLGAERIGWVLAPPDVIERARDALVASTGLLPCSHSRIAVAAFTALPALAARSRALASGKRERIARWVADRGLPWSAPAEGLFGFVTLPGRGDLTAAIESAANEQGVIVSPGAFFGIPNGFRLAWSLPADRLDEGLGRLGKALGL